MNRPFVLAHLSDPHLSPIRGLEPRYWNAKRALGLLNWHRKRRRLHLMPVLDRLVADLKQQTPDHIAVTGDLANLGLPGEHEMGLGWLERLGDGGKVSLVPGNHDIYSDIGRDRGTMRWRAYMRSLPSDVDGNEAAADFPYLRRFGRIAIVGLCSGMPTPPFVAAGRLGEAQLHRAGVMLKSLAAEGLFRVVLIHHPPLPGQAPRAKALRDAEDMQQLLREAGAELVLHGHNHRAMRAVVSGPGAGDVHVLGVPSASQIDARPEARAQYNLYRIAEQGTGWRIELTSRGLDPSGRKIIEIARSVLRDD